MRENTDQNTSEYVHFSRSVSLVSVKNLRFSPDLFTSSKELLNGKLHFLCSIKCLHDDPISENECNFFIVTFHMSLLEKKWFKNIFDFKENKRCLAGSKKPQRRVPKSI